MVRAVAAAAVAVLTAPAARANNVSTATGPGGFWSNPGTWVSNAVPVSGIDTELDFGGAGSDANTFTDDIGTGTFTLNEIQLNSTSTGVQTIAGNTTSNTLTFTSNSLLAAPQILQNGSGAYVINNGLALNNTLTLGGSGAGALSLTGAIGGTGGLTLNGGYTVTLTGQSTFTGNITINGGVLQAAVATSSPTHPTATALGSATQIGRSIIVNSGGQLVFAASNVLGGSTGAVDFNLAITINAGGVVSAAPGTSNLLGVVTLNGGTLVTNVGSSSTYQSFYLQRSLVNVGGSQPSMITAAGSGNNGIHLGPNPTYFNVADVTNDPRPDLTISAPLLGPGGSASQTLHKAGPGTLLLTGNSTYANASAGGTVIDAGALDVNVAGSLPASSNLTFNGTGAFIYENSGAQASHSQSLNTITFSGGDGTVEVDDNAGQVIALVPQYAVRSAGATGNFVVPNVPGPSKAEIALEGMGYFLNQGMFFNGSRYAWGDPGTTILRAIQYGTVQSHATTDGGAFTFSGGSTVTPTGLGVLHAQTTGPISGQPTATLTTLNLASNDTFSLASGATLTVNGILKSGNLAGGATIAGGAGIDAGSGGTEMVIRTDGPNDGLIINTPVLNNGGNPLTKSGLGTLTFGGVNTYTGNTSINAGTVTFAGSSGNSGGGGLVVGGTAGIATLNIATTGTVTFNSISIGGIQGSVSTASGGGAINQSAGTFNYSNGSAGAVLLGTGGGGIIGLPSGGYGAYTLSGGTLTPNGGTGNFVVGSAGWGNFTQTGGSFALGGQWTIGDSGIGVATLTGGTTTGAAGYGVALGNGGAGTLNLGTLAGGNATLVNQSTAGLQLGNFQVAKGLLNLNAGTLALGAGTIHKWTLGSALMNWNGGTLQAAAGGLTLLDNTLDAVNVFNGGAVVDTQGFNATISASLIGTAGRGIYPSGGTLNVPAGGAGYIGAPLVTVSGGSGTGATAIANLVNGAVTGVTLTSPGQNYQSGDVLTFTFAGGGAATPAPATQYTLQLADVSLNSVGGLKKLGSGTLILTGASTYAGATNILAGTLEVDGSLGNTPVNVAAGATLAGKGTIANAGANGVTVSGTVAPGDPNTYATLTTGPMTWAAGGGYTWKVSQLPSGSSSNGAGVNWDNLIVSSLSVTAGNTSGTQFTITPIGNPAGIQSGNTYRWQIAQVGPVGGPVGGFDPSQFVLNTSQFAGGACPANDFSIANNGNEVDVVFSPAPEPSSLMMIAAAVSAGLMRRRRRASGYHR